MKNYRSNWIIALLLSVFVVACSSDTEDPTPSPPIEDDLEIWEGADITFTKDSGADPTSEANQDRITANVWLTRGNSGGQIFNAFSESSSNKDGSPAGTLWAIGSIDDVETLNFQNFRAAVGSPKDVVGKNLVMISTEDNIALSIRFNSWDQSRGGGFSYTRSTQ